MRTTVVLKARQGAEGAEGTSVPRLSAWDRLTEQIIGAAIEVHRQTGPGLLESVYEECLCYELSQLGIKFKRQVHLPISYKGIKLTSGYKMDLMVEEAVIIELKTVDQLLPIHTAQLLTYLKLSGKPIGLLLNFNEPILKKGLKRLVNHFRDDSGALIPSAPSALETRVEVATRKSIATPKTLRLGVSAVKEAPVNHLHDDSGALVPSAPSALETRVEVATRKSIATPKTLRLGVSAVKEAPVNHLHDDSGALIPSAPSSLETREEVATRRSIATPKTLRLCVSAVKEASVNHLHGDSGALVPSAPSASQPGEDTQARMTIATPKTLRLGVSAVKEARVSAVKKCFNNF